MHRRLALLILVLVTASCATRSERETTVPSVPTSLVPNTPDDVGTGHCSFTIGDGLGALVSDIVAGGPAVGVVMEDDLIVALDETPIRTSADLVAAVRARSSGDSVTISVLRAGSPTTLSVTLGSSGEGRPVLGVVVTTLEEQVEPADVAAEPLDSPLVRAVAVDGALWLLDPNGVEWSALGVAAPEGAMLSLNGDVFTVEVRASNTATLIGSISGSSVDIDLIEWHPVSVIGTLNNLALIGAERTDADGAVLERAVIAVDPVAGAAEWAWITDPTSQYPQPVVGHRSLDGTRLLVGLGTADEAVPVLWVVVSEVAGQPVAAEVAGLPDDAAVLGWYDAERLIAIVDTVSDVALIDPATGTSVLTTMPVTGEPTGLWPVGDGAHILVEDGAGLVLATVGDIDRRELTASCGATIVSDLGWTAP